MQTYISLLKQNNDHRRAMRKRYNFLALSNPNIIKLMDSNKC